METYGVYSPDSSGILFLKWPGAAAEKDTADSGKKLLKNQIHVNKSLVYVLTGQAKMLRIPDQILFYGMPEV
ncbi:hypothetical protein [Chryseobacterium hagamense]|uniref:hypothetical protein n=1 Tax=Chryseobacterium hagamense TaxID=395935 RepID=UPI0011BD67F8|nr:hypothetical protein [Chryseobacterium hagamense]